MINKKKQNKKILNYNKFKNNQIIKIKKLKIKLTLYKKFKIK